MLGGNIGLLFVDGHHDYAAQDVAHWIDRIVPGGVLALHDKQYANVQAAIASVDECGLFEHAEDVDNMAVYKRKGS